MYDGMKVTNQGSMIHPHHKTYYGHALLSVIFMLFCSLFILNVFIGIVISTFNREEEKITKNNLLNPFQLKWVKNLENVL
jgi:hypothetical protein